MGKAHTASNEYTLFRAIRTVADCTYDTSLSHRLWTFALQLSDPRYRMYAHHELYWNLIGSMPEDYPAEKLSTECAFHLTEAYNSPAFTFDAIDVSDTFDAAWLMTCVRYAFELLNGRLPGMEGRTDEALDLLRRLSALPSCDAVRIARTALADRCPDGLHDLTTPRNIPSSNPNPPLKNHHLKTK